MMIRSAMENVAGPTDFDLHGLVGIRLVGASPAEVSAVAGQLGPIQRPLDRRPDIVVRFVDRLQIGSRLLPGHVMRRLVPLLERQRYVQVAPHDFFDGATGSLQARPDTLVFVISHDSPRVTVKRIKAQEIVQRMMYSLQEERKELVSKYRMFRFAFPERSNELIEKAAEIERARLERLWADREAYLVKHPYPASPVDLFEAIEPLLQQEDR